MSRNTLVATLGFFILSSQLSFGADIDASVCPTLESLHDLGVFGAVHPQNGWNLMWPNQRFNTSKAWTFGIGFKTNDGKTEYLDNLLDSLQPPQVVKVNKDILCTYNSSNDNLIAMAWTGNLYS